ncbi:outer membrane protein [Rhodoblastus sphagnicola]|uniref:outer membrane protein n=1 Tax=Rhodoblastus sphagnicola TaxID=333368 RepID=UPI00314558CC
MESIFVETSAFLTEASVILRPSVPAAARLNSSGVLGGGQVGVNYQLRGPFVVGLEADIQGASVTGEVGVDSSLGTTLSGKAGSRVDFLGTVRARVGAVILDRGLLYATGGFAYAGGNSDVNASYNGSSVYISKETLARGFAVGGGLEYALTNHWSLRSEYLYADLGKTSLYNGSYFSANANLAVETTTHILRAGVNYRFGGPELRIPTKPAMHSNMKPATYSDLKPASVPI